MSVYSGQVNSEPEGRPLNLRLHLSDAMLVADDNTYNPLNYSVPSGKTGSYVRLFPSPVYNNFAAFINASVNSPFYRGVYFQQDAVIVNTTFYDIGFVTSAFTAFFELFSTSSQKRTVQSISLSPDTSGVAISGLSVSDVFYPYEEKTVGLVVSQAGNATIDETLSVKFVEDSKTYTMEIRGVRTAAFFLGEPNWAEGFTVERRFLTSIFQAHDMSETRKVLRHRPVRSLRASLIFHDQDSAGRMWALSREAASKTTGYPWHPDRSVMTADAGASRVYCVTAYRRFQAGKYAFLVSGNIETGFADSEVVRVQEVFADGFLTDSPIIGTFLEGHAAYPALVCYANLSGNNASLLTDRVGEYDMEADEMYAASALELENSSYAPIVRNSLPTLDVVVTFSEEPSLAVRMGGDRKESGRGELVTTKGVPYIEQEVTALCQDKEECWNTIGFFNYLKGRGKPFWVRSEMDFLNVTASSGNTLVTVDNQNELRDWSYLEYLWVEDSTGTFDVIEVVDRQTVSGGTEFTLAANSLADIFLIWQAHAVRLSEDVITEEYLTDSVMLSTFTVQELQGAY